VTETRLAVWLFVVASAAATPLSAVVASGQPILGARWSLLWLLAAWTACWIGAAAAALRLPKRWSVPAVLGVAVVLRATALAGPPTTSDDLYRYAWDGRVQLAAVNPYAHPPASAELVRLRDPWLWPDPSVCASLRRPAGCTRINRPAVRTIYPPVAEAWFAVVARTTGGAGRDKPWQVAGFVTELATLGALLVALRRWGRDERWIALYALSPLPVLEFVNNGHVDGLAVALIVGALAVAAERPSSQSAQTRRDVAFGLLIGAAALVKIYPGLLLVAGFGLPSPRPLRSWLRATSAAVALAGASYLPHVLASGIRVVGYLPGYLREEHYQQGGRFLLAGLLGLTGWMAGGAAMTAIAVAAGWVVRRRPAVPVGAAVLLATAVLVATPVQPWYAVSLLAAATVVPWPAAAAVALAGYPYFFAVILDHRHPGALGRLTFGAAAVAVVVSRPRPGITYAARSSAKSMERQQ
jgi:hypothetical protein